MGGLANQRGCWASAIGVFSRFFWIFWVIGEPGGWEDSIPINRELQKRSRREANRDRSIIVDMIRNGLKRQRPMDVGMFKNEGAEGEDIVRESSSVIFGNSSPLGTAGKHVRWKHQSRSKKHIAVDNANSIMFKMTFTRCVSSNTISRGTKLAIQISTAYEVGSLPQAKKTFEWPLQVLPKRFRCHNLRTGLRALQGKKGREAM